VTSLADLYGDEETPDPDTATVETLNILTRRLTHAQRRLEAIRAPYHAEIQRVAEREEWATASLAQRVLDLNQQVRHVVLRLLEHDPRTKSWKLPHATVQSRQTSAEILVEDERVLIEWAEDSAPELLIRVAKVDKRAAKSRLTILPDGVSVATTSGELVPGVVVKPDTVTVSVKEATRDDEEPM
jgi:hypothetical protein